MPTPIQLEGSSSEVLVEVPTQPTNKVVIFLSGISGGVFSDRFKPFVDVCLAAGISVARVNAWNSAEEVGKKTFSEIHTDLNAVVTLLKSQGYTSIFGVGKSFGGAVLLSWASPTIKAKVLWAPAIGAVESGDNFEQLKNSTINSVPMLLDITLGLDFLQSTQTMPTLLIHGTADDTIPFSNSQKIVSMLPHGQLAPIDGADHSYKNKDHEALVTKATVDFLATHV